MLLQLFRGTKGCVRLAAPVATPLQAVDGTFVLEPFSPGCKRLAADYTILECAHVWLKIVGDMPPKHQC